MAPDKWMEREGYSPGARPGSPASLAGKWGVAPSTISRRLRDRTMPPADILIRFHVESGGEVSLADWIEFTKPDLKSLGLNPKKANGNGRRH